MMFMESSRDQETRIRLERFDYHLGLFRDAFGDGSDRLSRHLARLHLKEARRELEAGRASPPEGSDGLRPRQPLAFIK